MPTPAGCGRMTACPVGRSGNETADERRRPRKPQRPWGGLPTTLADLVMLRRAINEDWPVPDKMRQAIVSELGDEIDSLEVRRALSVARLFLAMSSANIRAERNG